MNLLELASLVEVQPEDLPGELAQIAEEVSVDAALRFAHAFGGIRFHIPRSSWIGEEHPIARALGLDDARAVAKLFEVGKRGAGSSTAGSTIEVPNCKQLMAKLHRAVALKLMSEGKSVVKVALQLGLSERRVRDFRADQRREATA